MIKIDETQIENKLKNAPKEVVDFTSAIYIDPVLEQMVGADTEDYETIIIDLADAIVYFKLGFIDMNQFKNELTEILYLEGAVEIQKAYDAINKFVLLKLEKKPEVLKNESQKISHQDLLSEIENPTPSISTTASFQNSASKTAASEAAKAASQAAPAGAAASSTGVKSASPAEASLHSSAAVPAYTNPALKIASKLDQNMSTPSASIPKDIYVSKKPDPYHEPVDL